MMRWTLLLFALLLAQCLGGSTPNAPAVIKTQALVIASVPVALDSHDPARQRVGALTYLGGWALTSSARVFGGFSALDVVGQQVTMLSDVGAILTFRLGRFGTAADARLVPVPTGCGRVTSKVDNDTESLTHNATRTQWWIGFEWHNAICRTDGVFKGGLSARPPAMSDWPRKRGPETLLRLADGRFLTIAEGSPDGGRARPAVMFDRDPIDPAARLIRLGYRPPDGFDPTDATQLADGRILILNRKFALTSLFTAAIVMVDPDQLRTGVVVEGTPVARFESPVITDNFEGIATTRENGRTIVWLVSDDNYMRWQRTLLLKFALD